MTICRALLVITAVCSALITATFIQPANTNKLVASTWIPTPDRFDNKRIEIVDALTLAAKVCTPHTCEHIVLHPTDTEPLPAHPQTS